MGAAASFEEGSDGGRSGGSDLRAEYTQTWCQYTKMMEQRANIPTDKESIMKFKHKLAGMTRRMTALEKQMEAEQEDNQTADAASQSAAVSQADAFRALAPPVLSVEPTIERHVNGYALGRQCHNDDLYAGVHPSYRRHLESSRQSADWQRQMRCAEASRTMAASAGQWQHPHGRLQAAAQPAASRSVPGVSLAYMQHLQQQQAVAVDETKQVRELRDRLAAQSLSSFHYNAFVQNLEQSAEAASEAGKAAGVAQKAARAANKKLEALRQPQAWNGRAGGEYQLLQEPHKNARALSIELQSTLAEAAAKAATAKAAAANAVVPQWGSGPAPAPLAAAAALERAPRMSYAVQQQVMAAEAQRAAAQMGQSVAHRFEHQYDRTVPDGSLPKITPDSALHMMASQQQQQQALTPEQLAGMTPETAQLAQAQQQAQQQAGAVAGSGAGGAAAPDLDLEGTTPRYRQFLAGRAQTRPCHPLSFVAGVSTAPPGGGRKHLFDYHPFFANFFSAANPLVGLEPATGGAGAVGARGVGGGVEGVPPGAFSPTIPAAQRPYETGARHPFWMLTPENPYAQGAPHADMPEQQLIGGV